MSSVVFMGIGLFLERANSYLSTNALFFRARGILVESGILTFLHEMFDTGVFEEDMSEMIEFAAGNKDSINMVRDLLYDDKSRAVYDSVIEYRCNGDKKSIMPSTGMYFPKDIISLSKSEVFVDCGAFSGDTVFEFIRKTRGKFKAIYAFEPSAKHYRLLRKNTGKLKRFVRNITLYNEGVWSKSGQLSFSEQEINSGASHVLAEASTSEADGERIRVNSLDVVFKETIPTFIKMDIEGSELEALKGAKEILTKYKPKLAICLYHKSSDFVEIPLFLKETVPDYKLHIRHHSCGYLDTVLYAVP
jgi:FkbM family methyltransferase